MGIVAQGFSFCPRAYSKTTYLVAPLEFRLKSASLVKRLLAIRMPRHTFNGILSSQKLWSLFSVAFLPGILNVCDEVDIRTCSRLWIGLDLLLLYT